MQVPRSASQNEMKMTTRPLVAKSVLASAVILLKYLVFQWNNTALQNQRHFYRFICRHLWYFFWCWLQIRIPFFSYTSNFRRVARLIFSVIFTIWVVIAAIFDIKSKMSDFFMTEKSGEVAFYTVETLFRHFFEWFRLAWMSYSMKWKKSFLKF